MADDQDTTHDDAELLKRSTWTTIGLGVASNLATGGVKAGVKLVGKQLAENAQSLKGDSTNQEEP
jgi:hypothetical protein